MRQGNVRTKCLNVVLERMRDSPDEFTPEVMKTKKSMAQFLVLKEDVTNVIRDSHESEQFAEKRGQSQHIQYSGQRQNQPGVRKDYPKQGPGPQVQAVAAPVQQARDVTPAHQVEARPQQTNLEGTVVPVREGMTGEVKRADKKITVDRENRRRLYTATQDVSIAKKVQVKNISRNAI